MASIHSEILGTMFAMGRWHITFMHVFVRVYACVCVIEYCDIHVNFLEPTPNQNNKKSNKTVTHAVAGNHLVRELL